MKTLLILFCLIFMIIFIILEKNEKYILAVILKGLASCMFVALGLWCSRVINADPQFIKMVRIGLILGLIADILLNLRFVFKKTGKVVFLVGILVFLSGHIFYICALIPLVNSLLIPILAGVAISVITLKLIFDHIEAQIAFKIFGVFYIGAIVIMNCLAISTFIQDPTNTRYLLFMIGALLFFVSDVVLILNTFGKTTRFSLRVTNLSLYYFGQMLIALSLLFPIISIA